MFCAIFYWCHDPTSLLYTSTEQQEGEIINLDNRFHSTFPDFTARNISVNMAIKQAGNSFTIQ